MASKVLLDHEKGVSAYYLKNTYVDLCSDFNTSIGLLPIHQRTVHDTPWFKRHLAPKPRHQPLNWPLPQAYDDYMARRRPWWSPYAPVYRRSEPREGLAYRQGLRHRADDRYHTAFPWNEDDMDSDNHFIDDMEPSEVSYDGDSREFQGSYDRHRSSNELPRSLHPTYRNHRHYREDDDEYPHYGGGMPRVSGRHPMDRHRTGLYRGSPYDTVDTGPSEEL